MIILTNLILLLFNLEFSSQFTDFRTEMCNCSNLTPTARIVNGSLVNPNDLSYVGSIFLVYWPPIRNDSTWLLKWHFCMGSLVADKWALTAAHCVDSVEEYKKIGLVYFAVDAGHDLEKMYYDPNRKREVTNFHRHDLYGGPKGHYHDIGLLEFEKPFILGKEFGIYLACFYESNVQDFKDRKFTAVGFGSTQPFSPYTKSKPVFVGSIRSTKSNKTTFANKKRQEDDDVTNVIQSSTFKLKKTELRHVMRCKDIRKNQICVRGKHSSTCIGDSGGPLFFWIKKRFYVVAIVNGGMPIEDKYHIPYYCIKGSINHILLVYDYLTWIKNMVTRDGGEHCIIPKGS